MKRAWQPSPGLLPGAYPMERGTLWAESREQTLYLICMPVWNSEFEHVQQETLITLFWAV